MDSNLARCLQLLFGVTLPHRNLDWAATAVRPCLPLVECKTCLHMAHNFYSLLSSGVA